MNENDKKILQLKDEIKKKNALIKKTKFNPITNCVLILHGSNYNLNVIPIDTILYLMASLNALKIALKEIAPEEELNLGNYSVDEWLTDLKSRLQVLQISKEIKKLAELEAKLQLLLTNETQVSLALKDIEDNLK